jgi:hypothetical protein
MKRSGNVGLVLMGGVAFAATFAAGMTYFAWQKPSHAAAQNAQSCVPQQGAQACEPVRHGIAYYFYPRASSGWTWSSGWGWGSPSEPHRQEAAFSGNARSYAPAANGGTVRSGFGASGGSFRMSAGG